MYDTQYPNVKIKRGNKYSWVHLNVCKIVQETPLESIPPEEEPIQSTLLDSSMSSQTDMVEAEIPENISIEEDGNISSPKQCP